MNKRKEKALKEIIEMEILSRDNTDIPFIDTVYNIHQAALVFAREQDECPHLFVDLLLIQGLKNKKYCSNCDSVVNEVEWVSLNQSNLNNKLDKW